MPMPDDFDGIFYGPTTGGNEMFDLDPEEFIKMCVEHEDALGSAQFYIAGALFDFLWNAEAENDYRQRYSNLLEIAMKRWPDKSWAAIPVVLLTGRMIIRAGSDPDKVTLGISNTIARLFGGATLEPGTAETSDQYGGTRSRGVH